MLRVLLICAMLLAGTGVAPAADIIAPPPERPSAVAAATLRAYLERKALVLLVREKFDVLAPDDVAPLLAADLGRMGAAGPSLHDEAELDRQLRGEGSYYLVSIEYLVRGGGAAWPQDRPASAYVNDALVQLAALADRLAASIAAGGDPLPVFLAAQRLEALAEGETTLPAAADRFGRRDELVRAALALAARPRA